MNNQSVVITPVNHRDGSGSTFYVTTTVDRNAPVGVTPGTYETVDAVIDSFFPLRPELETTIREHLSAGFQYVFNLDSAFERSEI